ncbi:hypothetical protein BDY17DRAFT_288338 [Neohortaea acidophila]|uniref:Uncharacterized protein n=1 Tax=Neohortaea acidophila TaxID=245834 RepID=A0A6A6Q644_9PEZI|nr:uncharacterized protein BDY17DRAFT_288338 [Neohortaea acidophila]KAF2487103.1 hypothetical protein BDY17DRAFT_288338 [Neohortaea acidophila]
MKHAHELAGLELKLVIHGRLEIELDAVDVVGATGTGADGDSCSSGELRSASAATFPGCSGAVTTRTSAIFEGVASGGGTNDGGVREGVLASLLRHGSAIGEERGNSAKAEARSSGTGARGAGADTLHAGTPVSGRSAHGSGSTAEEAVLAGMLLIELLAPLRSLLLASANAEQGQAGDNADDSENTEGKPGLCAAGHAGVLVVEDTSVGGAHGKRGSSGSVRRSRSSERRAHRASGRGSGGAGRGRRRTRLGLVSTRLGRLVGVARRCGSGSRIRGVAGVGVGGSSDGRSSIVPGLSHVHGGAGERLCLGDIDRADDGDDILGVDLFAGVVDEAVLVVEVDMALAAGGLLGEIDMAQAVALGRQIDVAEAAGLFGDVDMAGTAALLQVEQVPRLVGVLFVEEGHDGACSLQVRIVKGQGWWWWWWAD